MKSNHATDYYLKECSHDDFRLDGMRRIILPRIAHDRVLELGIGSGHLTKALHERGFDVTAVDVDTDLIGHLTKELPGVKFLSTDLNKPGSLPNQHYPCVIALDILEHLERDTTALESIRAVQKPGDQLIVLVPLYQRLYSHHDKAVGHVRRYQPADLLRKLRAAHYDIIWQRRWNAPGLVAYSLKPGAGTRIENGELVLSGAIKHGPIARALGWWLSSVESRWSLGFGLSLIVEARLRA